MFWVTDLLNLFKLLKTRQDPCLSYRSSRNNATVNREERAIYVDQLSVKQCF